MDNFISFKIYCIVTLLESTQSLVVGWVEYKLKIN